jgi:hypothetical protein
MFHEPAEIRWARPALRYLIRTFHPSEADFDRINALLESVRDHPTDVTLRLIVEAPDAEGLEDIEGDIYLSRDTTWDVYYAWPPDLIYVVHAQRRKA